MAVNKVIYGSNILIDLTSDTITSDKLASGYTAHDQTGTAIIGTANLVSSDSIQLSKTIEYSTAANYRQMIWNISEFGDFPFLETTFSDYEYIQILGRKINNSHATKQVLYAESFYPPFVYTSSSTKTGYAQYHNTSTSSVSTLTSSNELTAYSGGLFIVTSTGIGFSATDTCRLLGTYLFTLSAKLK